MHIDNSVETKCTLNVPWFKAGKGHSLFWGIHAHRGVRLAGESRSQGSQAHRGVKARRGEKKHRGVKAHKGVKAHRDSDYMPHTEEPRPQNT